MRRRIVLLIIVMPLCFLTICSASDDTDQQLRSKWVTMTEFLKQGNTERALELIHPSTRNNYAIMYEAIKDKLPQITSTQRDLNPIKIKNDYAMYELTTKENGKTYSYEVIFSKDLNGTWYILEY